MVGKLTNVFYAMGYNRLKELCWKEQKFENQHSSNDCFAPFEVTELNIYVFDHEHLITAEKETCYRKPGSALVYSCLQMISLLC